jgi:hypothetical protein
LTWRVVRCLVDISIEIFEKYGARDALNAVIKSMQFMCAQPSW